MSFFPAVSSIINRPNPFARQKGKAKVAAVEGPSAVGGKMMIPSREEWLSSRTSLEGGPAVGDGDFLSSAALRDKTPKCKPGDQDSVVVDGVRYKKPPKGRRFPIDYFGELSRELMEDCIRKKAVKIGPRGCWLAEGSKNTDGYPQWQKRHAWTRHGVSDVRAYLLHRVSFAYYYGRSMAEDRECSHLCDVRNCIRPDHLVDETKDMNNARRQCTGPSLCECTGLLAWDCPHSPRCVRDPHSGVCCIEALRRQIPRAVELEMPIFLDIIHNAVDNHFTVPAVSPNRATGSGDLQRGLGNPMTVGPQTPLAPRTIPTVPASGSPKEQRSPVHRLFTAVKRRVSRVSRAQVGRSSSEVSFEGSPSGSGSPGAPPARTLAGLIGPWRNQVPF